MDAKTACIGVSVRPDVTRAMWSIAVHCVAAAMVLRVAGTWSVASVLSVCVVLLCGTARWSMLLHWPRPTAIARVVVTHSGRWFLTDPLGFVRGARIIAWHAQGVSSLELRFLDKEWRLRRTLLDDRNSDRDERLRLALYLEYMAVLPGLNRPVPFRLHV